MKTELIVLAIMGVLAYMSVEYKRLLNGLPMILMGISVLGVVFSQIGYFSQRFMFIIFGLHAVSLGVIVTLDQI